MFLVPDTPPDIECYHDKGNVYAISWKVSLFLFSTYVELTVFYFSVCLYVPLFIKNDWIIITDTLQWTFWLRPVGHKRKRKMLKKNLWLFFNIFLLYLWPPGQCQKGLCRVLVIIVQSFFLPRVFWVIFNGHYFHKAQVSSAFRTLPNIYDGAFLENK